MTKKRVSLLDKPHYSNSKSELLQYPDLYHLKNGPISPAEDKNKTEKRIPDKFTYNYG